jgi:hypothetical protein
VNCRYFEALVFSDRTRVEDSALRDHARRCAACAERLATEERLGKSLKEAADEMRDLRPSPEVDRRVLAAFRSRPPVPYEATRLRWRFAAAAGVPIAILLAGIFLSTDRGVPEGISRRAATDSAGVQPETVAAPPGVGRAADGLEPDPREAERRRQIAETDLVTDYFALTSCPEMRCLEEVQRFRVRLPESSMAYFGLPVSEDAASNRIDADVLVGPDGVARAVRFVQPVSVEWE